MRLLIGPSCAGKSTYITRLQTEAAERGETLDPHYAFEVHREGARIPDGPRDLVHVNLLRGYRRGGRRMSVKTNDMVPRLIQAAEEVVVIAAPRSVLKARAAGRSVLEPDDERYADRTFNAEEWGQALDTPHLAQMYEQLALQLDGAGTAHRYVCSHDAGHEPFQQISRWEFPRLAREGAEERCLAGHELTMPDLGRTYQVDYREGASGSMRSATIGRILQMPLADKRLLDVGCAEGAASLSAARMGAQVTGLEPRATRLRKARAIAEATGSSLELHRMSLNRFDSPANSFDVVLALNVIHHVFDPFAFLDRAAHLTSSHLVLEYPGVNDPKFRRTVEEPSPASSLPFIGVSKPSEDQTYVFSPASFERYLIDYLGVFRHHEIIPSPIPERWISVFSGKNRTSRLKSAIATERRLKRRNAELRLRIEELEAGRSWPLTRLAQRVSGRAR